MKRNNLTAVAEFKCEKCDDKVFSTIQGLTMHNYRKHTHKGKKHGNGTQFRPRLMAMHKARKKLLGKTEECPVCHETFAKLGLGVHVRTMHKMSMKEARQAQQPTVPVTAKLHKLATPQHDVNICPQCGCNIAAVRVALNMPL